MNGVHDCGGMQCYRAIAYTPSAPPFHAPWEGRVLALNIASWYVHNAELHTWRSDIEGLAPVDYLRMSYYEIRFTALVNRLIAAKWVSAHEVKLGHSEK